MNMETERLLHLQEVSEAEFCEHIEDDDFFQAYGNPVIINCTTGSRLIAIAWPLEERLLRLAGRGDEADEIIRAVAEKYEQEKRSEFEIDPM